MQCGWWAVFAVRAGPFLSMQSAQGLSAEILLPDLHWLVWAEPVISCGNWDTYGDGLLHKKDGRLQGSQIVQIVENQTLLKGSTCTCLYCIGCTGTGECSSLHVNGMKGWTLGFKIGIHQSHKFFKR